jgi:broad specificity phosphatase PhoE
MKLYIFRHGMTYFSKHDLPYGDQVETAAILPEAVPTIERLASGLLKVPTDVNLSSPFKRCLQTSSIVSEITGKKFTVDEKLRDWDPRNETVEEMIERVLLFCKGLESKHFNSVAICTHGYPINAIVAFFTKGKIEKEDLDNFPDPGVLVTIENQKANYKDYNLS